MMEHWSHVVQWMADDRRVGCPESRPFSGECSEELSLSRSVSYARTEYLLAFVAIVDGSWFRVFVPIDIPSILIELVQAIYDC